jgi:hypothetical protein
MLIQEKLWKPKNDFFFLFAESYCKALGTVLFAERIALGTEKLFIHNKIGK